MKSKALLSIILLAGLSAGCAGPGPGLTGNAAGGIIPWAAGYESLAFDMAGAHCAGYGKLTRITSVYAQPGHYIGFACLHPRGYIVRERQIAIRTRG
jgi:hypothetical protein